MATMRAQKISRGDLSKFLPTPQLIKQFEAFSDDIVDNLPNAAKDAQETADEALALSETLQQQVFVIFAPTPTLPNSRGLAVDTGLSLVDGGAGGYVTLTLADFLAALSLLTGYGLVAKTASGSELREIEAGSARIEVMNGDGSTGNPAIDIDEPSLDVGNMGGTLGIAHGGTGVTVLSAFSVHNNSTNQSIPNSAFTQLNFSTEVFDLNGDFAANAWTPPAGRPVMLSGSVGISMGAPGAVSVAIFKNGAQLRNGVVTQALAGATPGVTVTYIDTPNGTDVYDLRAIQTSGVAQNTSGLAPLTWFCGSML